MGKIAQQSSSANARYKELLSKYGEEGKLRTGGAVSLIGADLLEGYNTSVNEDLRALAIDKKQKEISERGSISLLNIAREETKVVGVQEAAFAKSGVKLEGSALNVLSDTIREATESKLLRQREVSFAESQLEVEKVLSKKRSEFAAMDTLMAVGMSATTAYSGTSKKKDNLEELNLDEYR